MSDSDDADERSKSAKLEEKLSEAQRTIECLRSELKSTRRKLEAAEVARQHVERYVDGLRCEVRALGEQLQRVKGESRTALVKTQTQDDSDKEEGEITMGDMTIAMVKCLSFCPSVYLSIWCQCLCVCIYVCLSLSGCLLVSWSILFILVSKSKAISMLLLTCIYGRNQVATLSCVSKSQMLR